MNIENKLQEIGEYFKNKVVAGDYELKEVDTHTAEIVIDEKYNFQLWRSRKEKFKFWGVSNSTDLDFAFEFNQEERENAWDVLQYKIDKAYKEFKRAEKIEQYNQLKKELGL